MSTTTQLIVDMILGEVSNPMLALNLTMDVNKAFFSILGDSETYALRDVAATIATYGAWPADAFDWEMLVELAKNENVIITKGMVFSKDVWS